MRVVLSGPIQAVDDYEARFARVAKKWRDKGHEVFNPAELPLAAKARTATQAEHQAALRECIAEIARADLLVVLPEWAISKGARFEVFVASELGVDIRFLFPAGLVDG